MSGEAFDFEDWELFGGTPPPTLRIVGDLALPGEDVDEWNRRPDDEQEAQA